MSGNKDEHARLFTLGYDAGKRFLEGIQDGTIADEELKEIRGDEIEKR
jgi:hypothetical protein